MPDVVDPGPVIRERLGRLAAEYEPKIADAKAAVDGAEGKDRRRLAKELRKLEAAYEYDRRVACGGPTMWSA